MKVAAYCTKCGAEISAGAQTCGACGAPAPVAAVPAPPIAAPAKSGSSVLKIVLIVVATLVGLGIIAAGAIGYVAWRVAHSVHVSGNQVSVNIPGAGSYSANTSETFTASDLGTDLYPGAQSGKGSVRMSLPTGSMVTAVFVTSDSKDQVLDFYKERLVSDATTVDTSEGSVLTLKKGEQESVIVTIRANSSEFEGKTQITIVHTTANKPS